ncbi:MAG: thioredoxin family protein, partial [Pedobacter sp.]
MVDNGNIFDKEAMSYRDYRALVDQMLSEQKTTGPDNSPEMVDYSKMNVQRMNRLDKTAVLQDNVLAALA